MGYMTRFFSCHWASLLEYMDECLSTFKRLYICLFLIWACLRTASRLISYVGDIVEYFLPIPQPRPSSSSHIHHKPSSSRRKGGPLYKILNGILWGVRKSELGFKVLAEYEKELFSPFGRVVFAYITFVVFLVCMDPGGLVKTCYRLKKMEVLAQSVGWNYVKRHW